METNIPFELIEIYYDFLFSVILCYRSQPSLSFLWRLSLES